MVEKPDLENLYYKIGYGIDCSWIQMSTMNITESERADGKMMASFGNMEFDTETEVLSFDWSFSYNLSGRATISPVYSIENLTDEELVTLLDKVDGETLSNTKILVYNWADKGCSRKMVYLQPF